MFARVDRPYPGNFGREPDCLEGGNPGRRRSPRIRHVEILNQFDKCSRSPDPWLLRQSRRHTKFVRKWPSRGWNQDPIRASRPEKDHSAQHCPRLCGLVSVNDPPVCSGPEPDRTWGKNQHAGVVLPRARRPVRILQRRAAPGPRPMLSPCRARSNGFPRSREPEVALLCFLSI